MGKYLQKIIINNVLLKIERRHILIVISKQVIHNLVNNEKIFFPTTK